ncbi:hypothetical protein CPAST_c07710 [Clostridium pasteurianum DSM 525 = ATCC 6013]|uniref:DUF4351 domain-containing protein n=2 Tax=Clostridium pasteurianum TaxID=1501 RepID=A0A0H3IZB8_CLOPA|nr:hypothetical protein CPAST_c07710 [Clostridium pasteurianum DSM 525 = ATCC 6013]AJA50859.1 hypothetical protein CLPA_c07710 [Clostridium pasteurianum DSM 525 = ATCC 6013]ELP58516.1 hypothetical protein F502_13580 [Clostridium pasteurianum DSM 525 = ATCC 6013]KRU13132.1 protein of unknown function DUF4351 [Clostridium pasteurianum DSM 525 = ATCC 6013]
MQHENKRLINDWIAEYINNIKDPLYAVIMNVLTEANFDEVLEVYKDMRKVNVNENNREFLLDMMRKLELDKKIREEGKSEIILKLLIKKFKKLPEEYVEKIKKLSNETLEVIAIDIFDMDKIEELEKYFNIFLCLCNRVI